MKIKMNNEKVEILPQTIRLERNRLLAELENAWEEWEVKNKHGKTDSANIVWARIAGLNESINTLDKIYNISS